MLDYDRRKIELEKKKLPKHKQEKEPDYLALGYTLLFMIFLVLLIIFQ